MFALTACNDTPAQNGEGDPTGGEDDTAGAIYYGKIVALDGDTMMLVAAGESANSADVCRNSLSGLTITDNDGNAMGTTELSPGMLVEVAFSGQIMAVSYTHLVPEAVIRGFFIDMPPMLVIILVIEKHLFRCEDRAFFTDPFVTDMSRVVVFGFTNAAHADAIATTHTFL